VSSEKITFFKNYRVVENASQHAFPAHRQNVEITTMDVLCQLIFHDFEVFFKEA